MKKKIAVVFNRMVVGGAEKALLNFLKVIDTEKYDVTLFTFSDTGAYFDEIPPKINVQFTSCKDAKKIFLDDLKNFRLARIIIGIYCRMMIRVVPRDAMK